VDEKGRMVGKVTSCAIDSEGYLLGQAFMELKAAVEGTRVYIFQGASDRPQKSPADLTIGDRMSLPGAATVISRFPRN
jgi:glycine hydroxymethyltransferase